LPKYDRRSPQPVRIVTVTVECDFGKNYIKTRLAFKHAVKYYDWYYYDILLTATMTQADISLSSQSISMQDYEL